jgi:hypothetical protein
MLTILFSRSQQAFPVEFSERMPDLRNVRARLTLTDAREQWTRKGSTVQLFRMMIPYPLSVQWLSGCGLAPMIRRCPPFLFHHAEPQAHGVYRLVSCVPIARTFRLGRSTRTAFSTRTRLDLLFVATTTTSVPVLTVVGRVEMHAASQTCRKRERRRTASPRKRGVSIQ